MIEAGDLGGTLPISTADDQSLLAHGNHRLVCLTSVSACALFDIRADPKQSRDIAADAPDVAVRLRARREELLSSFAEFETAGDDVIGALPPALRRGLLGDASASGDVALLLDDADVRIRRQAAAILARLRSADVADTVARALAREEDTETRAFLVIVLARFDGNVAPVRTLLSNELPAVRHAAALLLAEHGDRAAGPVLVAWAKEQADRSFADLSLPELRALVAALGSGAVAPHDATPSLVRALAEFRIRGEVAGILADLGDTTAVPGLLKALSDEHRPAVQMAMLRALKALHAPKAELADVIMPWVADPDSRPDVMDFAREYGIPLGPRPSSANASGEFHPRASRARDAP